MDGRGQLPQPSAGGVLPERRRRRRPRPHDLRHLPRQQPCLEYALDNRIDHGVWGGTSERERRRILKRRRLAVLSLTAVLHADRRPELTAMPERSARRPG